MKKVVFLLLLNLQWPLVVADFVGSDNYGALKVELIKLAERVGKLEKENVQQNEKIENLERENIAQKQTIDSLEVIIKDIEREKNVQMEILESIQKENEVQGQMIRELETTIGIVKIDVVDDDVHETLIEKFTTVDENRSRGRIHHGQNGTNTRMDKSVTTPKLLKNGKGIKRLIVDVHQTVAFTARITPHDYGPLGPNQILKFDDVLTNLGNGYHPHSGTFIAPVDGVYMIFITVAGNQHHYGENYVQLKKNGQYLCEVLVSHYAQSSQMVFLSLKTNDEVFATNNVDHDVLLGAFYTSFSGILLYPTQYS